MKKLFVAIILGIIITFQVLTFIQYEDYSEYEARTLKPFPKLNKENLVGGEFAEEFEEALSDHAPMKEKMITANSYMKFITGVRELNGVYLTGEILYQKPLKNPVVMSILKERDEYPNLECIMLPYKMYYADNLPLSLKYDNISEDYIKAYNDIRKYADVDLSEILTLNDYFKSDHHLNDKGVAKVLKLLAYEDYSREDGVRFIGGLRRKTGFLIEDEFFGLYNHTTKDLSFYNPDDKSKNLIVDSNRAFKIDSYLYYMGGNYGEIKINGLGDKSLLLIKDSFANPFIGFLAMDYGDICVIDARFYKGKLKEKIDDYDKVIVFGGF